MDAYTLRALLEASPVIAAVTEERFKAAVASPAAVLLHLHANLLHIAVQIDEAHKAGKCILVHLDLAEGIGRDRTGIDYLRQCGVDGILTVGMGMPPFTRFTNAGIKVYSDTTEPNVGNVARLFAEGKVALMDPANACHH